MNGSIKDYDDLSQAYALYMSSEGVADGLVVAEIALGALKAYAERCGMPSDEPTPIQWVRNRLATYRRELSSLPTAFAEIIDRYFPVAPSPGVSVGGMK